jgi:hypothetical protein
MPDRSNLRSRRKASQHEAADDEPHVRQQPGFGKKMDVSYDIPPPVLVAILIGFGVLSWWLLREA